MNNGQGVMFPTQMPAPPKLDVPTQSGILADPFDEGRHNRNIEQFTSRIIEGASWKRQRVVMVIPTGNSVPARCALSWMNLIFPPNNPVARWLVQNMEVGDAYSTAFNEIVSHPDLGNYEYILTVEHDNVLPGDAVLKLIHLLDKYPQYDAIQALYWTKGENGVPQIWGDINDTVVNFRAQPPPPSAAKMEILETYGVAMGCTLFRMDMFKDPKLQSEKPWFKTTMGIGGVGTQDLNFWIMARKYGFRCAVACDVRVGHFEPSSGITW